MNDLLRRRFQDTAEALLRAKVDVKEDEKLVLTSIALDEEQKILQITYDIKKVQ